MARGAKRNRGRDEIDEPPVPPTKIFKSNAMTVATNEDRMKWKGWCEMESEPAFFNVMLNDLGVKGLKIVEVVSLDDDVLAFLPQPVYGLIFLSRWREDESEKQIETCPPNIWFANQTVNNACASVAMLNIVNNIPGIQLGEHLSAFKAFTTDLTPALRGEAIRNYEFLRQIHNSFGRKMDMLISDLHMQNHISDTKRSKKSVRVLSDEAGFHFTAFMPISGHVFKLDGLERQPQDLGSCEGDAWLATVRPEIEARMSAYEDEHIEFAILGIARDPMINYGSALTQNIRDLRAVEERLSKLVPNWIGEAADRIVTGDDGTLEGVDGWCEIAEKQAKSTQMSMYISKLVKDDSIAELRQEHGGLAEAQKELRSMIREEQMAKEEESIKADNRRHDFSEALTAWVKALAGKRQLEELTGHGEFR